MEETIFVSVASYRDPICTDTLNNIFKNADNPSKIYVGVCQQNNETDKDCLDGFQFEKANVRIIRLPYYEAKGPTYARHLCSTLWNNETYYLQIDSHTAFVKGWDKVSKNLIKSLKASGVPKPVLSYYVEELGRHEASKVTKLCNSFFNEAGMLQYNGASRILENDGKPAPNPYISGHFFFCESTFLKQLPFDPDLPYLFMGEEILLSARFYTHGWDIYSPPEHIVYHEYTRADKPKYWNEVKHDDRDAILKVKKYLKMVPQNTKIPEYLAKNYGHYGLGHDRTIEQYYDFAGIDLKNQKVVKNFCTLEQKETFGTQKGYTFVIIIVLFIVALLYGYR
jgi:GT2 family glycosyltransferase